MTPAATTEQDNLLKVRQFLRRLAFYALVGDADRAGDMPALIFVRPANVNDHMQYRVKFVIFPA